MVKRLLLVVAFVVGLVGAASAQPQPPNLAGPIQVNGGMLVYGSITQSAIGTPSAPTVTNLGTPGSTSKTYYCVATDINGKDTVPSSSTVDATGPSSLSANPIAIQCGGSRGAYQYKVLKTNTSTLLGTCNSSSPGLGGQCQVTDKGQSTSAYTAQTVDQTGAAGNTSTGINASNQHYLSRATTSLCSTSGGSNAVCGEPTITGLPFADANYNVACSCIGTPTGAGAVSYVVKAAATGGVASNAQVFIGASGQGTFSCAEVDCDFWHD